ncbi:MAG: hypothetical protein GY826_24455, partial [Fuerstiella sp.]|nr:hypothetical protein [Fuerstiella sp.]
LGAAGFALFVSPIVLGEQKGVVLILLVLAVVGVAWLSSKLKKRLTPQPEKPPIPDTAIRSQEPDVELSWCGHCKAHTQPGQTTVRHTNEHGAVTSSYQRECCGYCKSYMLWNVPSHIRQATNWTVGCATIPIIITAVGFITYALYESATWLATGMISGVVAILALAFLGWMLYLRLQWCHWVKRQPTPFSDPLNRFVQQQPEDGKRY